MKLKSLLSIINCTTNVKIYYEYAEFLDSDFRVRAFYNSGYPARLYENLPEDILNLQVLNVKAMAVNEIRVSILKGKRK